MWHHQILSDIRFEVSCDERDLYKVDLGHSRKQILDEEYRELLTSEEKALSLSVKKRVSVGEHMNNYTKLLADMANMDEMIKNKDKVLILSSYLSDYEYETFVLTLINDKSSLSYDEVTIAIVNHELRRKDKESSSNTAAEA